MKNKEPLTIIEIQAIQLAESVLRSANCEVVGSFETGWDILVPVDENTEGMWVNVKTVREILQLAQNQFRKL